MMDSWLALFLAHDPVDTVDTVDTVDRGSKNSRVSAALRGLTVSTLRPSRFDTMGAGAARRPIVSKAPIEPVDTVEPESLHASSAFEAAFIVSTLSIVSPGV
jgi:hypothetical protein